MKINIENVFIGTIRKCTKYEICMVSSSKTHLRDACIGVNAFEYAKKDSVEYKEYAKLLKVTDHGYIDLDLLNNFLDEVKIKRKIKKDSEISMDGLIMSTSPNKLNILFVDESTLVQYKPLKEIKRPTVKKLKKTMLMDSRVPGGIEW